MWNQTSDPEAAPHIHGVCTWHGLYVLKEALGMYCIERQGNDCQWKREICFKTEFKAFVNARTKSMATLGTYRVVHATWANQVVAEVNGVDLVKKKENRGDSSAEPLH